MDPDAIKGRAAWRAYLCFRRIPGQILELEDFQQLGEIQLWQLGDRARSMDRGLLYTILYRRMVSYGRSCLGAGRRGDAEDLLEPVQLDLQCAEHNPADRTPIALEMLLVKERERTFGDPVGLLFHPLLQLTPKQRIVLQLYIVEDLTQEQTALRCGATEEAVRQHVYLGVRTLRRFFAEAA